MSLISTWSTVANDNGTLGSTPFYWPEGQAPSTVNDCARLMMATIRTQWNDAQWFDWGYLPTRVSGTSFTLTTASWNTVTIANVFQASGRIKLVDSVPNTLYGAITTVSISAASVQVTFTPDASSLTATLVTVFNSIITPDLKALPPGGGIPANVVLQSTSQLYAADGGSTDAYAISMSPTVTSLATGELINFKANTANTGAATLNVDGLGAVPILKNGATALATNDILAGQIVTVIYDGTNFQMQSQVGNAAAITGGRLLSQTILTSGSAATYTKPGGANALLVQCVGGGGGGASTTTSSTTLAGGGGGGSGGYCSMFITSPQATYTYTIGSGGAANTDGTATTFAGGSVSLSAGGGQGAQSVTGSSAGSGKQGGGGGSASGGDINIGGGSGNYGFSASGIGAFGGSGADSNLGGSGTGTAGGAGGNAAINSGGGGGGSGNNAANTTYSGGSGGTGIIIISEYS